MVKTVKKKYTLYSATDNRPNSEKPCAFYFSDDGCRNGDKCAFKHTADDASVSDVSEVPEVQSSKPVTAAAISADIGAQFSSGVDTNEKKKLKKEKKEKKREKKKSEDNSSDSAELQFMKERLRRMEEQLTASKNTNDKLVAAQNSGAKSAKKEKNQTPGGQMVTATPSLGFFPNNFDSGMVPMSVVQSAVAPPPGISMHQGAVNMSGGAPGTDVIRPKSNFLSPSYTAGGRGSGGSGGMSMAMSTNTKKNKRREEEEDTAFLFGAVNSVLGGNPSPVGRPGSATVGVGGAGPIIKNLGATAFLADDSVPNLPPTSHSIAMHMNTDQGAAARAAEPGSQVATALANSVGSATFPFLEREIVMKTLNTSGTNHATGIKKDTGGSGALSAQTQQILHMIRNANAESLEWGKLVYKTQQSHRFQKEYNFDMADSSWVRAHAYGQWCAELPPVLAIDCEMCGTKDPVSGERHNNSLIRFSVVNGLRPDEVLIDQLVKPTFPVVESRAHIHGIHPEKLENVTFTLRHAQAMLMQICSDHTIIVGHSVHNDLKALKFLHHNCIDTSYLFAVENEPWSLPSMRDVSQHVLGTKLGDVHDSVQDARAANQAAMFLLVQGCPEEAPTVPRTGSSTGANLACQLLAHRLPDSCDRNQILSMILKYTKVVPDSVEAITGDLGSSNDNTPRGKVVVTFETQAHAELAFDTIPGPNRPDKAGKAQKRIYFKGNGSSGGGYINLRKQI